MTFDEFLKTLDGNNRWFNDLADNYREDDEAGKLIIEPKREDLLDVVLRCKRERLFPIVDKRLSVVIGCEHHGLMKTDLFRYHYYARTPNRPNVSSDDSEDRYVLEGHGWLISKMRPAIIVAGERYQPDDYDLPVFARYKIEHQDLTYEQRLAITRGAWRFR